MEIQNANKGKENIETGGARLENEKPANPVPMVNFLLIFVLIILVGANQIFINQVKGKMGIKSDIAKELKNVFAKKNNNPIFATSGAELTGNLAQDAVNLVISKGIPDVYGEELGVSFDEVQKSMDIMRRYDPWDLNPGNENTLTGDNLKRYTDIGLKIACEYCCRAKSLVFQDGKSACGCAHSMAMRGLAAYLIKNHGDEYSDNEILKELARWKGVYFPKQMMAKMTEQIQNGNYSADVAAILMGINLPSYKESGAGNPPPSDIKNLPSMVGGC